MDKKDLQKEKQDRLAQALRDNLRRRKQPPRNFGRNFKAPKPAADTPAEDKKE